MEQKKREGYFDCHLPNPKPVALGLRATQKEAYLPPVYSRRLTGKSQH